LTLSAITKRVKIFTMTMIRLSGSQLHAASVLVAGHKASAVSFGGPQDGCGRKIWTKEA
jgi:hypothetical protein